MAIAALICGISSATFSTLFTWIFSFVGFPWFAVIGLITGVVGLVLSILASKANKMNRMQNNNGMILAGLICSIVGMSFGLIGTITCIVCPCVCLCQAANDLSSLRYYY